jgi:hypothetical protein
MSILQSHPCALTAMLRMWTELVHVYLQRLDTVMLYLIFFIDDRDITYVDASGSVLTAAGCNSNGANVVILDMLAPPATCQTSIVCHEGELKKKSILAFYLEYFIVEY